MKPDKLHNVDQWMLGEDIPNADLFFSSLWLHCFVTDFSKHTGRAYEKILCRFSGYHLWFYFGEKDSFEVGENIVDKIVDEKGYAQKINKNIIKQANILRRYVKSIPQKNVADLSNAELWTIYKTHQLIHQEYYTWCWIPVAADMFHNNLTNRVKTYLRDIGVSEDNINEYFVTLTQPTKKSLIFKEQQDLLKIGLEQDEEMRMKLLEKHRQIYYYTKHLWVEGEYTVEDYKKQLDDILQGEKTCAQIIKQQNNDLRQAVKRKKELMKQLHIDKKWQTIFHAFGDFMVTKIYRRYAQIFAVYQMTTILKEIAKRMHVTEKQVRFMLPCEVERMLLYGNFDTDELLQRTKECVYYADKHTDEVYIKEKAKELMAETECNIDTDVQELRGEIGCPGLGSGEVKVIIRAQDMEKMNKGDVLVSIATDPDIVPAMKKASAIITEQGGVTSHAAIVARELGIPCVIGTKIATRVLKDGQHVEVDAHKGIITIL